ARKNQGQIINIYDQPKKVFREPCVEHLSTVSNSQLEVTKSSNENKKIKNDVKIAKTNPHSGNTAKSLEPNHHVGIVKPLKKSRIKKTNKTTTMVHSEIEADKSSSQVGIKKPRNFSYMKAAPFKHAYISFEEAIKADNEEMMWSAYTKWKEHHRKEIYSGLIDYYINIGSLDKAISVFNDFMPNKLVPDKSSILDFFQERISLGLIPGNSICASAMYMPSSFHETIKLYQLFKSNGIEFKRKIYEMMLKKCRREKNIQLFDIFYRDMVKLDSKELDQDGKNCLQLIEKSFIENNPKQAVKEYMEITSQDIQSHPLIILTIFQGLFGYQQFEMAYEAFDKMSEKGISINYDLGHYICLAFLYGDHLRYSEKVIYYMITARIITNNQLFEELAHTYLSKGFAENAEMMILYLKSNNGSYSLLLNKLVDHYIKLKNLEKLKRWVDELAIAPQIKPGHIGETILLNAYGMLRNETEFLKLWEKMQKTYLMEELGATISLVIDHFGFSENLIKLRTQWKIFSSDPTVELNLNHYNSYIEALCRCKAFDQAASVFTGDFVNKEIVPNLRTLLAIITPLRAANKKIIESNLLEFVKKTWPNSYIEFCKHDIAEQNFRNSKSNKTKLTNNFKV
ncbi:6807_t:CDS:1, partial [Acaulospora colombiana]